MRVGEKWTDSVPRIDDLLNAEMPLLLRYYSGDRMYSDAARKGFLEPDLDEISSVTDSPKRFRNG